MEPDVKQLLQENLDIAKQNNHLLKKVHSLQKWSQIARVFYWIVIFGMAFGAFYFVKPFLGNIISVYSGGISDVDNIQDIGKNIPDVQKLKSFVENLSQ